MKKKKILYQFLFSTEDMDFDVSRVEVIDSETGTKFKVDVHMIRNKRNILTKVFSLRLPDNEIEEIKNVAEGEDLTPAHFARRAIRRAVAEKEADNKRLGKEKRQGGNKKRR